VSDAFLIISASPDQRLEDMKLFTNNVTSTGIMVMGVLLGILAVVICIALGKHLRQRRLQQLPVVLGDPKELLDRVAAAVNLTTSDKYLLNKLAYRLRLPQPVTLIISPPLLVEAAELWYRTHRLGAARQWGINRLNWLAKSVHRYDLFELAEQLDMTLSAPHITR